MNAQHIMRLTEILLDTEMMVRVYENLIANAPTAERAETLNRYRETVAALKAALGALSREP